MHNSIILVEQALKFVIGVPFLAVLLKFNAKIWFEIIYNFSVKWWLFLLIEISENLKLSEHLGYHAQVDWVTISLYSTPVRSASASTLFTSESDVYRRQILTSKVTHWKN